MKLKSLRIIGFVSFPSRSLQDANPQAYHGAVADILNQYPNAGTCAHCGMGIIHNVVVKDSDGITHCIGTDCAERIGADPVAVRQRITTEEREARDARMEAERSAYRAEVAARDAALAARKAAFADLLTALRAAEPYNPTRESFSESLANQLEVRPLSDRQAHYAAKFVTGDNRRTKANAVAWDAIVERVTAR
jgi:hypothetical protein